MIVPAEKRSRSGWMLAVAATVLAPLAIYLICRAALAALSSPAAVAAAAALPPPDYSPALRSLSRAARLPAFRINDQMLDLSRKGAASTPLAFEPFFIAARGEEQAGRLDRAILLMEEARRRRPSHPVIRMQLVAYYGKVGRLDDLFEQLDITLRLNDEARRYILPELAALIGTAQGRRALAPVLASEPGWREDFYRAATARNIASGDALALLNMLETLKKGVNLSPERSLYLQALVQEGEYAKARTIWLRSLARSEQAKAGLVFDGGFTGSKAPAPFNWSLHDSAAGRAEIASPRDGTRSLDVYYFGGSTTVLAEQTLALPAGRYRLSIKARSDSGVDSADLYWAVNCLTDGKNLVKSPLQRLGPTPSSRTAGFEVPAGCKGQRLFLVAEPGDVASTVSAQIGGLEISRG